MSKPYIPGQSLLYNGPGEFRPGVMLLVGPPGAGKTLYCMQFLRDGIEEGAHCFYIDCGRSLNGERFPSYFAGARKERLVKPVYVSPFSTGVGGNQHKDSGHALGISELLRRCTDSVASREGDDEPAPIRIALDSLTDLLVRYSADEVDKFVAKFQDFLKGKPAKMALLTLTGTPTSPVGNFGSLVDGIMQLRTNEVGDDIEHDIRIFSLKASHNTPRWVRFKIAPDGGLLFGRDGAQKGIEIRCKVCDRPIMGEAVQESGSSFHPNCLDTFRKLGAIYGSNSVQALQPGVVNANFFFVDIVGLSDPCLSVENQIRKIEDLNIMIGACEAYSKVADNMKIVLPTGDGMVVGFLVNPELPLLLSIQLHQRLRAFNARQPAERTISVRIGISSGPVFVVTDIKNNQNVWGPGIILARRVMDLGDNGHILLAGDIAETLRNLKDEYRSTLRLISGQQQIKHGQVVRIYSAYSENFGNPVKPERISNGTDYA